MNTDPSAAGDRLAELERLQALRERGAIDDAEFAREKVRLLAAEPERRRSPLNIVLGALALVALLALAWFFWPRSERPDTKPPPVASATLLPRERLAAAVAAAFPDGATTEDDGQRYTFTNHKLIDAPFGPVLVSEGKAQDDSHVAAGRLAVTYLRSTATGFAVAKRFPKAVEAGSFGEMSDWSVSDKFADVPTLDAEGGFTGQGITCSAAALTELRASGPVQVALVRTGYDDSGAVDDPVRTIEGKFAAIHRGNGFDVRYTGTSEFTEHWARNGGKYVLQGMSQLPEC